jgi:hypothetical protein
MGGGGESKGEVDQRRKRTVDAGDTDSYRRQGTMEARWKLRLEGKHRHGRHARPCLRPEASRSLGGASPPKPPPNQPPVTAEELSRRARRQPGDQLPRRLWAPLRHTQRNEIDSAAGYRQKGHGPRNSNKKTTAAD